MFQTYFQPIWCRVAQNFKKIAGNLWLCGWNRQARLVFYHEYGSTRGNLRRVSVGIYFQLHLLVLRSPEQKAGNSRYIPVIKLLRTEAQRMGIIEPGHAVAAIGGRFYPYGVLIVLPPGHHQRAKIVLQGISETLITTWPVLTETTHLLNARLSPAVSARFLNNVADGFCAVHAIDPALIRTVSSLMSKYADLPMDLADASLLLLAEHLGDGRILSTDRRDFQTYRFKNHQPFRNLLLED